MYLAQRFSGADIKIPQIMRASVKVVYCLVASVYIAACQMQGKTLILIL